MDREVIEQKLESLRRCLQRVSEKCPADTMGQTFDALAHAGAIPEGLAQQLKKAVGLRNIAVHHYEAINWTIVHRIAMYHLNDFTKVVAARLVR